jgi:D-alanyl-D-alanine carboxypeptidase (penicillin-binding protein 5/6)
LIHRKVKTMGTYLCLSLMLNLFLVSVLIHPATASAAESGLSLEAGSAVLMEASTGQILYSNNENVALPPASMSKMMTEYLVLDAVEAGNIKWEDVVTTSENAATTIGSRVFLAQGDKHTVKELYIAMAIASANDASVALAEFIAGSEENFADRMNAKAREIGLSDQAHFINATGLNREDMKEKYRPTTIQGETLMSAKDSALLALNILQDHPDATEYSKIPEHQFRERDKNPMVNLNRMLEGWANFNNFFTRTAYEGLDGFKTGHTNEAGYCFTGTAVRDGMRLISVVMNTASEEKRFEETEKLLNYGFNNFEKKTVLSAKTEIEQLNTVEISKGVESQVSLVTEEGLEWMIRKGDSDDKFIMEAAAVGKDQLVAPIKQGDVLGTVTITYKGDGMEKMEETINLVASEDAEKASWIRLLFRAIGNFFASIFNGIKGLF